MLKLSVAAARLAFFESLVGRATRTRQTYTTALDRFEDYLVESGFTLECSTGDLGLDALEQFYLWLVKRYGRASTATCATYLAGVRAFFRFLDRRGIAPAGYEQMRAGLADVVRPARYRAPRVDDRVPSLVTYVESVPLPLEGLPRIIALRDRALLRVLYTTAVRRDEAVRLNREDVRDGRATQALITGKGGRERVIFFDSGTLGAIQAYLAARSDTHRPLFLRHDGGRGAPGLRGERWRMSADTLYSVVKRTARAVGSNATPHSFRHDRATLLLNRGADLSEVQDILGHASPETTKRIYAHYETRRLREAFDRYSLPAEKRGRPD
ncbi:MAG: tyrosine-type recombinase/integrase [Chloroflexota bacterium]